MGLKTTISDSSGKSCFLNLNMNIFKIYLIRYINLQYFRINKNTDYNCL